MYAQLIGAALNVLQKRKQEKAQQEADYLDRMSGANNNYLNSVGGLVSRGQYAGANAPAKTRVSTGGNAAFGAAGALGGFLGDKLDKQAKKREEQEDAGPAPAAGGGGGLGGGELTQFVLTPEQGSPLDEESEEDKWKSKLSLLGGLF